MTVYLIFKYSYMHILWILKNHQNIDNSIYISAGITCDNRFCDMFALGYNDDPSSEVLSNLPTFCTSFNFENQTINKQFMCTFMNISASL